MANSFIKKDKATGKFNLIEVGFDLVLESYDTYEAARRSAKFINSGGAFAGHTPPFILKKAKKK